MKSLQAGDSSTGRGYCHTLVRFDLDRTKAEDCTKGLGTRLEGRIERASLGGWPVWDPKCGTLSHRTLHRPHGSLFPMKIRRYHFVLPRQLGAGVCHCGKLQGSISSNHGPSILSCLPYRGPVWVVLVLVLVLVRTLASSFLELAFRKPRVYQYAVAHSLWSFSGCSLVGNARHAEPSVPPDGRRCFG